MVESCEGEITKSKYKNGQESACEETQGDADMVGDGGSGHGDTQGVGEWEG